MFEGSVLNYMLPIENSLRRIKEEKLDVCRCEISFDGMIYICSDGRRFRLRHDIDDIEFI